MKSGLTIAVETLTSVNHTLKKLPEYELKKIRYKNTGELRVSQIPLALYKRWIDWWRETHHVRD